MNSNTFDRLACQHATVDETVSQGHLLIEGNGLPSEQLAGILQEFIRGPVPRAHR
jgi:hypothetical protein